MREILVESRGANRRPLLAEQSRRRELAAPREVHATGPLGHVSRSSDDEVVPEFPTQRLDEDMVTPLPRQRRGASDVEMRVQPGDQPTTVSVQVASEQPGMPQTSSGSSTSKFEWQAN